MAKIHITLETGTVIAVEDGPGGRVALVTMDAPPVNAQNPSPKQERKKPKNWPSRSTCWHNNYICLKTHAAAS